MFLLSASMKIRSNGDSFANVGRMSSALPTRTSTTRSSPARATFARATSAWFGAYSIVTTRPVGSTARASQMVL